LRLQKEIRTPLYRIQLDCRGGDAFRTPVIIEQDLPVPLPPEIARMVHWRAPESRQALSASFSSTERLPILMYHSVNHTGPATLARYRIAPEQFEEQIAYLRDAGYYSTTFEQWRIAAEARKPLPGHAIILTFDDGYRDFRECGWPILKRYGFSAVVFLVASQLGGTNVWDSCGLSLPLLDAGDIQQLQQEGVDFGSHSMSHRSLLTLQPEEVALEHLTSSSAIRAILGRAVEAVAYPYGAMDPVVQI
jgi:peptidoglycan/xylan/chitin deacetylase (PgdA/CDA1 family)